MRATKHAVLLGLSACLTLMVAARPARGDAISNVIDIDGDVDGANDWCSIVGSYNKVAGVTAPDALQVFFGVVPDPGTCSIFSGGGSKDELDTPNWLWKSGSVPDKDNIRNAASALLIDPVSGDHVLAFFGDRLATNGDAQIGIWFFQDTRGVYPQSDGTFGPGKHMDGDLLVLAHFVVGGASGELLIYRWQGNCAGSCPNGCKSNLCLIGGSPQEGIASALNIQSLPRTGHSVCFLAAPPFVCPPTDFSGWQYEPKNGTANTYPANSFFEGAVNLSKFSPNALCFHSFIMETRSSQSTDAVLKDFVAGRADTCPRIQGRKELVPAGGDCSKPQTTVLNDWEIRLYEDKNKNGQADPDELVTKDGNGALLVNPVCTGSGTLPAGAYVFENLPPRRMYAVYEVVPSWQSGDSTKWEHCFPADGRDGTTLTSSACKNAAGAEWGYSFFELKDNTTKDFRNLQAVIETPLKGMVFCDVNGNGVKDAEDGLSGFCIVVKDKKSGAVVCKTVTDAGGLWECQVDSGATYVVDEDLTGSGCTSTDKSKDWIVTTTLPLEVSIAGGATSAIADPIGNASKPTLTCGTDNVTVNADEGKCTAHFCFTPKASNACGDPIVSCEAKGPGGEAIALSLTGNGLERCGEFPDGCDTNGVSTVTCTAKTAATANHPELTSTCSFKVAVKDTEPPVITMCESVVGDQDANCDRTVTFRASVTDNCGIRPEDVGEFAVSMDSGKATIGPVTCTKSAVNSHQVDVECTVLISDLPRCPVTIKGTLTAKDACGNEATACENKSDPI